jgi:hypothetical protein
LLVNPSNNAVIRYLSAQINRRAKAPAFLRSVLVTGVLALGGCAQTVNPEPSRLYDGRYVGTRESNLLEACGITAATGRTTADIASGTLKMQLFNPGTRMTGTVGADGRLRASGLWKSPHSFHNFTILHGQVVGGMLTGTASDSRCTTELALKKIGKR